MPIAGRDVGSCPPRLRFPCAGAKGMRDTKWEDWPHDKLRETQPDFCALPATDG